MQRKELNSSLYFRVPANDRLSLGKTLFEIAPALTDMMNRWQADPWAKPSNDLQSRAISVLGRLQNVSRHVKGTTGYKQSRRHELRGLIWEFGTPTLFITINPADLYNPVFGMFGGIELRRWQNMSLHERAVFIATHPHVAAMAFHEMITAFLDVVVRPKRDRVGLFGNCIAHYGMVEAQGRGTLHVHMLLWIKGSPNPQALRDRMQGDETYKLEIVCWLEDTIRCELPGQTRVVHDSEVVRPALAPGELDPRLMDVPQVETTPDAEFLILFRKVVTALVNSCNWHQHTDTCWKHLRSGQPRDDAHCRMRIDGTTRPCTEIDPESLSVLLRRLHPRINNYNETLIFLLQCNMDIKYISSGPAAKALVFYITDYITKSSLSVHTGLDAIKYALNCTAQCNSDLVSDGSSEKSLFVKSVNALMARQEMSHQQVMSYLVGGGDHYKSHAFVSVSWDRLENSVRHLDEGHGGTVEEEEHVAIDREGIDSIQP